MSRTILALESLQQEVSFMVQHTVDEGREHLNALEIQHLVKMINDVVMNIQKQPEEFTW